MSRLAILFVIIPSLGSCSSDPGLVGDVPTNPDALYSWLQDRRYSDWERESSVHPTQGPHGSDVRTYFNEPLSGSLEAGNEEHVVASAAVKELYEAGIVVGWAVMVKTDAGSGSDTWYWYEVLDRERPSDRFEGQGLALCAGCHSMGIDHVRTPWPE